MKHLVLASLFFCLPAAAQVTVPQSVQQPTPKFHWKLRLTQGEKWKQTLTTRSRSTQQSPVMPGGVASKIDIELTQTLGLQNEVVEVAPTYYLVRVTYTQFKTDVAVKVDGKIQKMPAPSAAIPQPDFVGVSFMVKQAFDGRVLDVTGLETLIARQKKMLEGLSKDPATRAMFGRMTPSVDSFKQTISRTKALALARKPLAVGESYSYGISVPVLGTFNFSINGNRTLASFDDQTAVFDEGGTFTVPPSQLLGPTGKQVTLKGDAAKLYLAQKYRATPNAQPTYLSKNGRIYYREAGNPQNVIWLDPPAQGVKLSESAAAPYQIIRGYNGETTGRHLDEFFAGPTTPAGKPFEATPAFVLPKTFLTMNGTLTGKSTVDVATGLTLRSNITQSLTGRVTIIDATGKKQTVPLTATAQSLSFVQKG